MNAFNNGVCVCVCVGMRWYGASAAESFWPWLFGSRHGELIAGSEGGHGTALLWGPRWPTAQASGLGAVNLAIFMASQARLHGWHGATGAVHSNVCKHTLM